MGQVSSSHSDRTGVMMLAAMLVAVLGVACDSSEAGDASARKQEMHTALRP